MLSEQKEGWFSVENVQGGTLAISFLHSEVAQRIAHLETVFSEFFQANTLMRLAVRAKVLNFCVKGTGGPRGQFFPQIRFWATSSRFKNTFFRN